MYIVNKFEMVISFKVKTKIYCDVCIILDVPVMYRNARLLCHSECACLHKTVNMVKGDMVVFFAKSNETI